MIFEDLILSIIQENSGGVKMTQLISDIFVRMSKLPEAEKPQRLADLLIASTFNPSGILSEDRTSALIDALNHKLEDMEANGKIGLLNYGWNMGGTVREKTFVYCPLEGGE